MTLQKLLAELSARQVRLIATGDKLEIKARPGALTPELVNIIKSQKANLLAVLSSRTAEAAISPVAPLTPVLASPAQRRLWFIHQLKGDSLQYHMPATFQFTGVLDLPALEGAFRFVLERHQVLRSCFYKHDGDAYQQVMQAAGFAMSVLDLSAVPEPQASVAHQAEMQRIHWTPFRLDCDYMLRAGVVKTAARSYHLYLCLHHIAFDGWSQPIFLQELMQAYFSLSRGTMLQIADLPIQYRDYSAWCWQKLNSAQGQLHLDYWLTQLVDLPLLHSLPLDKQRPAVLSGRANTLTEQIGASGLTQLKSLASSHQTTLFVVLYGLFAALLGRFSHQLDIVLGTPVSGRTHRQLENLLGFFVNTLVLRLDLQPDPDLSALIDAAKTVVMNGLLHQDTNFDTLVERLNPERAMNRQPLCQIAFALNQAMSSQAGYDETDLQMTMLQTGGLQAKFDLSLEITEHADHLTLQWIYSEDLFDASTIAELSKAFGLLWQHWLQAPTQSLQQLDLLSPEELAAQRQSFLLDRSLYPAQLRLEQFVAEFAMQQGDAIAVIDQDGPLSYAELQQQVQQLAKQLLQEGAMPATAVLVALPRTRQLLVGVLAILSIGAFYVPVSTTAPAARNMDIVSGCRATLLLGDGRSVPGITSQVHCVVYQQLMARPDLVTGLPMRAPAPSEISSIAYLIFTSGSTGEPKGVAIAHRSVTRLVVNNPQLPFNRDTVMLHLSASTFDASVLEIWAPLLNGGTVVMYPGDTVELNRLSPMIRQHAVNSLFMTSALFDVWVDGLSQDHCSLKYVFSGGDVVSARTVEKLYQLAPEVCAYNLYGPTEDAVVSACFEVPRDWCWEQPLPVGTSIGQSCAYIMTAKGGLQPRQAPGELWLGGDGLALGYYGRDDLTAAAFKELDGDKAVLGRLYRSGDLARRDRQGLLHYLARIDNQVKLRGFRIELGEIELCIRQQPAVLNVSVVPVDSGQHKKLVAFIAVNQAIVDHLWLESLQQTLQARLPDYMVPSLLVPLAELPLTSHGKVDVKTLLAGLTELAEPEQYQPPANAMETALQHIWQSLLGEQQISVTNSFFAMGGHSLLAMKLAAQVERQLERQLTVDVLFRYPTIRELARYLDDNLPEASDEQSVLPPSIRKLADNAAVEASYAQLRLWFIDTLEGDSSNYHIPLSIDLKGKLNLQALQQALDTLLSHHQVLRTVYVRQASQVWQQVLPEQQCCLSLQDLSALPPECQQQLLAQASVAQASARFDLSRDLMMRTHLVRLAPSHHRLLLTLHHIAVDGWSVALLLDELQQHYIAYSYQANAERTPPLLQYRDYAFWQRQWLQGDVLQQQLKYWQHQLRELPVVHSLPLDKTRPERQTFKGQYHACRLNEKLSEQLRQFSQRHQVSLYLTMQAAFIVLIARLSGQTDVVLGTPVAGRGCAGTDNMLGLFVNSLVIRHDVSENPSFVDLLSKVATTHVAALAHQHLPFEMVVEALNPPRGLGHSPLFQLLFTLQQATLKQRDTADLAFEMVDQGYDVAKFDLAVTVIEHVDYLNVQWQFNVDLFEQASISGMAHAYETLLTGIVADPASTIAQLPLVDAQERDRLLGRSQAHSAEYPKGQCLQQLISAQATRTPDALALVYGEDRMTYQELEHSSNQIAHYLLAQQFKPGQPIALCFERGLDMVLAIVATLKAGCPYLPLAVGMPVQRLSYIIQDADVALVLTAGGTLDAELAQLSAIGCSVVQLDDVDTVKTWSAQSIELPALAYASTDLAYILYTSGSTGKPKGVKVAQAGVVNLAYAMQHILYQQGTEGNYRWAWNAAYVFDASVQALTQLAFGVELHLLSEQQRLDPSELAHYLNRQRIDVVDITPSLLRLLLAAVPDTFRQMPNLLIGGEAINAALWSEIVQYNQRFGSYALNLYGPTECTVNVTWSLIDAHSPQPQLGQAIPNVQLLVLDAQQQLVPACGVGELCVAGVAVANGYVNLEAQTAAGFIDHPFATGKVYRTGDLVRWSDHGILSYLGRIDQQVKFRGFRIELGEIEASLLSHHAIKACAVVLQHGKGPMPELIAYYVPQHQAEVTAEQIKQHLQTSLPAYMVPCAFVVLNDIPLNSSGKLRRDALPDVGLPQYKRQAAATATEMALQTLLQQTVGWQEPDFALSFFENGGHSLSAVLFVQALHKQFGLNYPLRRLYQNEPLAELARQLVLNDQPPAFHHEALLQLSSGSQSGPRWIFIHALSGLPGAYQTLFEHVDPQTALYAAQFLPEVMPDLTALVNTYADALMAFDDAQGMVLVGWSVGGLFAHALCNELESRGRQQLRLVMLDSFAPEILRANQATIAKQVVAEQAVLAAIPDRQAHQWLEQVPVTLSAMASAYIPVQLKSPVLLLSAADNPAAVPGNGWTVNANFSVQIVQGSHQQFLSIDRSFDTISRITQWVMEN